MEVDPITLAVIKSALDSIVDDMAYAVIRTARSEIIKDVMDYSAALCDADGLMIAQAKTIALEEFEASQLREPERFRGYAGAAQAARQTGDTARARRYFTKLVEMAGAGATRPEIVAARAFLAANP